jgi:hypothetical protein
LSPPFSIIIRIVTDYIHGIEALAIASIDSLDYAMLYSSYKNAINLTYILHSSKNLTNRFTALITKNKDLMLECGTTITNHNVLTTWVIQLEAQPMQTLALATASTNSLPTSHKG